nr:hypothetical protein Iba_chr01dCG3360 [Ipomoea batatas]
MIVSIGIVTKAETPLATAALIPWTATNPAFPSARRSSFRRKWRRVRAQIALWDTEYEAHHTALEGAYVRIESPNPLYNPLTPWLRWLTTSIGVHTTCAAMDAFSPAAALAMAAADASENPSRTAAVPTLLFVISNAPMYSARAGMVPTREVPNPL